MNYALIENDIVTNLIWLYPSNASDFPNAVPYDGYPVAIGDTYENGIFYRDGEKVVSYQESYAKEINELNSTIAELDSALFEATYQSLQE